MYKIKTIFSTLLLVFLFSQQSNAEFCNVTFTVETSEVACHGTATGKITITITDGTPPFLYSIDGGNTFFTENIFNNILAGSYEVFVEDAIGCDHSQEIIMWEPFELAVNFGESLNISLGSSIQLAPSIVGSVDLIEWSSSIDEIFSCTDCFAPTIMPLESQSIYLQITDANGCTASDSIFIEVIKPIDLFIPNAFSPNGDGNNDMFTIFPGQSITEIKKFIVFNNWGNKVYESFNIYPNWNDGWNGKFNGKPLNIGVFAYMVEAEYIDGRIEVFYGDVTITH